MTNALMNITTLTMSSREIAELTGKRHDNVVVDIKNMLDALDLHAPDFSGTYKTARGNTYDCYYLPKELTITLVSGYNVQMRHAITKRWMELEEQAQDKAFRVPQSLPEALRLAAELEEQRQALLLENEVMKPKAEGYDTLINNEGLYTTTQAANILGYRSAQALNDFLRSLGWKSQKGDTATAYAIEQGYLTARVRIRPDSVRTYPQVYITPKGLAAVQGLIPSAA